MMQLLQAPGTRVRYQRAGTIRAAPGPARTVLLALDGSPAAMAALPTAQAIAAQLGSSVEVLHVAPTELSEPELRRLLDLEAEPAIRVRLRVGDPVQQIVQSAAEPGVALMVMTTHGHEVEARPGLTSVAASVLARAARPTLFVRPEAAARHEGAMARMRRFLVPVAGDPATVRALGPAMDLITRLGGSAAHAHVDLLVVAHPNQSPSEGWDAIRPPAYVDQPQHEWPAWNQRVQQWLLNHCHEVPAGLPVQVFLAPGIGRSDVGNVIAEFAPEHDEDAIVLVRRSHLEPGRALVLRHVVSLAPCPVLVVPGLPAATRELGVGCLPPRICSTGEKPWVQRPLPITSLASMCRARNEPRRGPIQRVDPAWSSSTPSATSVSLTPVAEQVLGWRANEVVGRPCVEVFDCRDAQGDSLCKRCGLIAALQRQELMPPVPMRTADPRGGSRETSTSFWYLPPTGRIQEPRVMGVFRKAGEHAAPAPAHLVGAGTERKLKEVNE